MRVVVALVLMGCGQLAPDPKDAATSDATLDVSVLDASDASEAEAAPCGDPSWPEDAGPPDAALPDVPLVSCTSIIDCNKWNAGCCYGPRYSARRIASGCEAGACVFDVSLERCSDDPYCPFVCKSGFCTFIHTCQ